MQGGNQLPIGVRIPPRMVGFLALPYAKKKIHFHKNLRRQFETMVEAVSLVCWGKPWLNSIVFQGSISRRSTHPASIKRGWHISASASASLGGASSDRERRSRSPVGRSCPPPGPSSGPCARNRISPARPPGRPRPESELGGRTGRTNREGGGDLDGRKNPRESVGHLLK